MRTVVVRVFDCSLDGVIAAEGTDFFQFCRDLPDDPAQLARTRALYGSAEVHVMGRKLYQEAAEYFPTAVDHPYSDVMNAARKMVFSRTLQTADWANSTVLSGDLSKEIEELRQDGDGKGFRPRSCRSAPMAPPAYLPRSMPRRCRDHALAAWA